ncbi:CAP domain-containing protein [Streptomyces sp. MST-110588]|uniref:CAP domain-containing protein n=1 Tax=Streptomyces sp. MST-110588 TaxID=2833628 RepID=UPI001F5CCB2D|nr:CAP domain-containing protein [Streptomyces sp. MST-110588]UNO39721.1 CAP domain-containing protein [Streptomyces sp. MST-110588]
MGRHRRVVPQVPTGTGPVGEGPAEAPGGRHRAHRTAGGRRAADGRRSAPVRTGLLGASAAVAMGAVAVASGLVPGGGRYDVATDGPGERIRAGAAAGVQAQNPRTGAAGERATQPASRGTARGPLPDRTGHAGSSTGPSTAPAPRGTAGPSRIPGAQEPRDKPGAPDPEDPGNRDGQADPKAPRSPDVPREPRDPQTPKQTAGATRAPDAPSSSVVSQVLTLVNQERAKAGVPPLTADPQLDRQAQDFSEDMARRGFFSHTDPDGRSPWDRARAAGVENLGGENIARGQADARAVMETWMNSPGHRANILNRDYKTLGVGVHFGPGGPWWVQSFGF